MYTLIEKPQRDFSTDYLTRHYTAGVAYCNIVFNFFSYFTQMKKFRVFRYNFFCRSNNVSNQPEVENGERGGDRVTSIAKNCYSSTTTT